MNWIDIYNGCQSIFLYFCKTMSDFASNEPSIANTMSSVDFSKARKLERSGSTCVCYETHLNRRHVFVKRLKEEYRHMPTYLEAFDKEFDTGISLDHPCLPTYREFHGDYIVIDYIDGCTLADMIASKDPWLNKEINLRKMISDLIDVVDYLHRRNVIHCDIKPDNVMIKYDMRTLKLIDLDKAYTDWSEQTSGLPENYGMELDDIGSADLDFRGIGKIIDRLIGAGYETALIFNDFSSLCRKSGVTPDELRDAIPASAKDNIAPVKKESKSLWLLGTAIVVGLMAVIGISMAILHRQSEYENTIRNNPSAKDTLFVKQEYAPIQESSANVASTKTSTPAYEEVINKGMEAAIKPMDIKIKEAASLASDSTMDVERLRQVLFKLNDTQNALTQEAYNLYKERYPEIGETTIEMAVVNSPAYRGMSKRHADVSQKVTDRIEQIYNNQ